MQCRQCDLIYKKWVKLHKKPGEQVVVTRLVIRNLVGHLFRGDSDSMGCRVTYPLPAEGDMLPLTQLSSNYICDPSFKC